MELIQRLTETISAVCPIVGIAINEQTARIDFAPEATSQQQANAQSALTAFDWSEDAHAIWIQNKLRAEAKQFQDSQQAQNVAFRAFVKLVVDENNLLRQWITDFKAVTAAAGSLAALKTGVAGLPNVPQHTYRQAKTALNNLVDGE